MESVLEDLSPESLAFAIEANRVVSTLNARYWNRATIYDEPEMAMVVTDIPVPLFNVVTRVLFTPENLEANIEKAIGRFREKGVPGNWFVGPATQPPDIGNALLSHGFAQSDIQPGMAVDLRTLPDLTLPPGFEIEPLTSVDQLKGYGEVTLRGFGLPASLLDTALEYVKSAEIDSVSQEHSYLGLMDGKTVGVSTVIYGAGVAGIYRVATIPEARGKGVGTAMTLRPLLDARDKGYRVGILQSSKMGYSVYKKIGFREYCKQTVYTWEPG